MVESTRRIIVSGAIALTDGGMGGGGSGAGFRESHDATQAIVDAIAITTVARFIAAPAAASFARRTTRRAEIPALR